MPTIFCDNDGCMFFDGCGFCDCDKLSIIGGVCEGSMHSGRNASDGDVDERLKAENAKLRKVARDAWSLFVRFGAVEPYNLPEVDRVRESLQELGIEVHK